MFQLTNLNHPLNRRFSHAGWNARACWFNAWGLFRERRRRATGQRCRDYGAGMMPAVFLYHAHSAIAARDN